MKGKCAKKKAKLSFGQTTVEVSLAMIIVALMIYALAHIVLWAGTSLVDRKKLHDENLVKPITGQNWNAGSQNDGPLGQLDPHFYKMRSMNAIYGD